MSQLKALLEKSRNECKAVMMELEQAKQDFNKLATDIQLVWICRNTFVHVFEYFE